MMKPRHAFMIAGLVIAAWLAFFGDKTPAGATVESLSRAAAPALSNSAVVSINTGKPVRGPASKESTGTAHELAILALQPRDTLIGSGHSENIADVLFSSQNWAPPPPRPKPTPPPPPAAPSLPFTYLGKKMEDGVWEVYVAKGDQTFIARVPTVIDNVYRVDSIQPPVLSLTYLPLNQIQTLAIGGID